MVAKEPVSEYLVAPLIISDQKPPQEKLHYPKSAPLLAKLFVAEGLLVKAMTQLMEILDVTEHSQTSIEAEALLDQARIYNLLEEHEQSLQKAHQAHLIFSALNRSDRAIDCKNLMGESLIKLDRHEEALDLFQEILGCETANDQQVCWACQNLGIVFYRLGQYGRAREFLKTTLEMGFQIKDSRCIAMPHYYLGKIFLEKKLHRNALDHFVRAFDLLSHYDCYLQLQKMVLQDLIDTTGKLGDLLKLQHYTRLYLKLDQRMISLQRRINVQELEFRRRSEKTDKELQSLEDRNASLRKLNNEVERQRHLLELKTRQLEDANENLRFFTSRVTHDIKAPVHTLESFTKLLSERIDSDEPKINKYLKIIHTSAHQLSAFIDDMHLYSIADAKRLSIESVSIRSVVEGVLEHLQIAITEADAEVEVGPLDHTVLVNRTLVHSIFQNLISNALKYRSPGRKLKIAVGVNCTKQGEAVFWVQDNGRGIKAEDQQSIFQLFVRGSDVDDRIAGSGIGLASVQRILESYGGQIWLESIPGEGSTFSFTLEAGLSH